MEPKEHSLSVWFTACTANHNYHLETLHSYNPRRVAMNVLGLQLATVVSSQ